MIEEERKYVYIDGTYIEENRVIEMAKMAGSLSVAEHYLCPLLYHALIHKKQYLAEKANEIRKFYNLQPYTSPYKEPTSNNNMPQLVQMKKSTDDIAREKYKKMNVNQRIEVVKRSLSLLSLNDHNLFSNKSCWIGIYLVIKSRLITKMNQQEFTSFAEMCAPSEWGKKLKIGKTTMSNMGRYISYDDRKEDYYDMEDNPFEDLCEKFWSILLIEILTEE